MSITSLSACVELHFYCLAFDFNLDVNATLFAGGVYTMSNFIVAPTFLIFKTECLPTIDSPVLVSFLEMDSLHNYDGLWFIVLIQSHTQLPGHFCAQFIRVKQVFYRYLYSV